MSRALRLTQLLQVLRRHRRPVAGQALAEELGISLRTLYRDIETLREQGADLRGEAGVGYQLEPGDVLPPLTLPPAEIDALVLGLRWVAARTEPALAEAARDALARIAHVLPAARREALRDSGLRVGPSRTAAKVPPARLQTVREAVGTQQRLQFAYEDAQGRRTERVVWPFALGYFDEVPMLAAWCEGREDFRHFRLDRIRHVRALEECYLVPRATLLRRWQKAQGIAPDWLDRS
ncbi:MULTISPECIES: helix-turn-helix transcriptional regulator [Stenotrophomonas]|uniref:YafY family transcriptional regulator n=1 Tax=Stenotrophomonas lactitubi TaxID=2045214 RepID=A0AAW4GER2_9GAMM|nr:MULTISPECIES: YafY family protein [Stenotrophomonas]MBM9912939.1 YafY family transcriptional regulator [Stenotrophomonas lactitubi]MBM9922508.1 YafY family transcriptional regulator [Stenotrophomonas lactitubi]MBM9937533.1 YafY family transcriptional regulator [Stenotrophomonas lactitubi]MBN5052288.1 YafY family transcriptional regulator [Stenotrophomonas maltophilia]